MDSGSHVSLQTPSPKVTQDTSNLCSQGNHSSSVLGFRVLHGECHPLFPPCCVGGSFSSSQGRGLSLQHQYLLAVPSVSGNSLHLPLSLSPSLFLLLISRLIPPQRPWRASYASTMSSMLASPSTSTSRAYYVYSKLQLVSLKWDRIVCISLCGQNRESWLLNTRGGVTTMVLGRQERGLVTDPMRVESQVTFKCQSR